MFQAIRILLFHIKIFWWRMIVFDDGIHTKTYACLYCSWVQQTQGRKWIWFSDNRVWNISFSLLSLYFPNESKNRKIKIAFSIFLLHSFYLNGTQPVQSLIYPSHRMYNARKKCHLKWNNKTMACNGKIRK